MGFMVVVLMPNHHDIDDLISVLDHRIRREVIHYLVNERHPETDLDAIAAHIAEVRKGAGESIEQEQLALRLHHLHLPKLADTGLIEFDPRSGLVRYLSDSKMENLLESIYRA